jgi:hypothetical protein
MTTNPQTMMTGTALKKPLTKQSLANCKQKKIQILQHVKTRCSKKNLINCTINSSNRQ